MSTQSTDSYYWCKICGITSPEEASAIDSLGADSVGLNFYNGSPRVLDPVQAQEIALSAGSCAKVGLFVDPTVRDVEKVLSVVELDLLQFHGKEPPDFCESFGKDYVKAVRIRKRPEGDELEDFHPNAWAILIDKYVKGVPGGTGETFDWELWPVMSRRKLILSGGLTIANVFLGVQSTNPFGVDVSSGVEGPDKGVKDLELVEQFIKEIRSA